MADPQENVLCAVHCRRGGCVADKQSTISVRVGEETKRQLDKDHLNTSSLLRELAENYLRMGDVVEVSLRRRLKDKEQELDDKRLERTKLDNEIERLEREVDELQAKIEQRQEAVPEEVSEFVERVRSGSFGEENLVPDNPAVANWATKAGIPAEEFVYKVEQRL